MGGVNVGVCMLAKVSMITSWIRQWRACKRMYRSCESWLLGSIQLDYNNILMYEDSHY